MSRPSRRLDSVLTTLHVFPIFTSTVHLYSANDPNRTSTVHLYSANETIRQESSQHLTGKPNLEVLAGQRGLTGKPNLEVLAGAALDDTLNNLQVPAVDPLDDTPQLDPTDDQEHRNLQSSSTMIKSQWDSSCWDMHLSDNGNIYANGNCHGREFTNLPHYVCWLFRPI
jgi:hypothetical protein